MPRQRASKSECDFKNHPFKVQADSQMKELQESIKKYGILNPLIVRPRPEGFYEIASAEEVAGLEKSMQKIIADIITEASSVASCVYVEKNVHHKSLQEMLREWKYADKFILVIDTWFEKFLEA